METYDFNRSVGREKQSLKIQELSFVDRSFYQDHSKTNTYLPKISHQSLTTLLTNLLIIPKINLKLRNLLLYF